MKKPKTLLWAWGHGEGIILIVEKLVIDLNIKEAKWLSAKLEEEVNHSLELCSQTQEEFNEKRNLLLASYKKKDDEET